MRIVIVGASRIAETMARLLIERGHQVTFMNAASHASTCWEKR